MAAGWLVLSEYALLMRNVHKSDGLASGQIRTAVRKASDTTFAFDVLPASPDLNIVSISSYCFRVAPGISYSASNLSYLKFMTRPSSSSNAVIPPGGAGYDTLSPIPASNRDGGTSSAEAKLKIADRDGFRSPRSRPPTYDLSSFASAPRRSWLSPNASRRRRTLPPKIFLPESSIGQNFGIDTVDKSTDSSYH